MHTLVLGTAGHIDHGKSTLVEALTGAHPDRLAEERRRGITIELGFGHAQIGDVSVAFVDVPGHERFVRTMLAGAGGLDAVLLVIAADESVMPQTREHLDICRLLGVRRGVIVLTKADLVDADGLALVEMEARELVAGTGLADAPVVPVSARTGAGLDHLRAVIASLVAPSDVPARGGDARLPIDRAFTVKGFGTVVTGTLVTGTLAVDEELCLWPEGRPVRVRGLQVHGAAARSVAAARRVAVNLGGVELQEVHRGMTLAAPTALAVTRRFDVWVELLAHSPAVHHGGRVHLHQGTTEVTARLSIAAVRESERSPWVAVAPGDGRVSVPPGGQALARCRVTEPLALTRDDRFVLRLPAPARTVGGGVVLDPEAPRAGVRRRGAAERLAQLVVEGGTELLARFVSESGLTAVTTQELARRSGLGGAETARRVDALVAAGRVVRVGSRMVDASAVRQAAEMLTTRLAGYHRQHPEEPGPLRESIRGATDPEVFDAMLHEAGVGNADRLRLPSHVARVSDSHTAASNRVDAALREAGLQPPDLAGLSRDTGLPVAEVTTILHGLAKTRRVSRLADLWFHGDALTSLTREVAGLGAGATIDIAWAKARYGLSRKFAVPLLEFLDRERVTRRVGDKRVVL